MNSRKAIFDGIRAALSPLEQRAAYPDYVTTVAEPQWLAGAADSKELFEKRMTVVGGLHFATAADCARWLKADGASLLYLAPELAHLESVFAAELTVTREYSRERVDQIDAAVTLASGAIGESGTIILSDSETSDRLAALAPWRHVAAIPANRLFRTISDAIAALPADPNVIWITGPSKTADVEGILIEGVHGPGKQAAFFV
jgi:L-lactate dehydrogenase complex protein LldG